METRWKSPPLPSYLHAAQALVNGLPLADTQLAAALGPAAMLLGREIEAAGLPAPRFWRHLLPMSANIDGKRQAVEAAVTKTIGRGARFESQVAGIAAAVAGIETAGREALPNLDQELELRQRPIREQWEARGPGLLHQLVTLTDERLLPESSTILLVHPALGGDGRAYLPYNQVQFEAVLANPHAGLPEVVRLAWLIAQLQLDLPAFSEQIHADRLPHIARFAMLPPVLAAAEAVELAALTPETLNLALTAWRLTSPPDVDAARLLTDWWQTCRETQPPWPVALAALDQLFG
jgi:hypothetical protein